MFVVIEERQCRRLVGCDVHDLTEPHAVRGDQQRLLHAAVERAQRRRGERLCERDRVLLSREELRNVGLRGGEEVHLERRRGRDELVQATRVLVARVRERKGDDGRRRADRSEGANSRSACRSRRSTRYDDYRRR